MVYPALQEEHGQDEKISELAGLIWGPWQIQLFAGLNNVLVEGGKVKRVRLIILTCRNERCICYDVMYTKVAG